MNAGDIMRILIRRHKNDMFFNEVKTGSTWMSKIRILDGLAIPYSWTKPIIGYEIKVSRSDFLSDSKWPEYLDYCHELNFVCPPGIIRKEDLMGDASPAGLFWVADDGKRLRRIKWPTRRGKQQIPYRMFQYLLMYRVNGFATCESVKCKPFAQHSILDTQRLEQGTLEI